MKETSMLTKILSLLRNRINRRLYLASLQISPHQHISLSQVCDPFHSRLFRHPHYKPSLNFFIPGHKLTRHRREKKKYRRREFGRYKRTGEGGSGWDTRWQRHVIDHTRISRGGARLKVWLEISMSSLQPPGGSMRSAFKRNRLRGVQFTHQSLKKWHFHLVDEINFNKMGVVCVEEQCSLSAARPRSGYEPATLSFCKI